MLIDDSVAKSTGLSERARTILEDSDRKIQFKLRKHTPKGKVINCYLVYHSTARGPPCKGGIRMSTDVSLDETAHLAEIMTHKNSLMGLPFGGGKAGIKAPSSLSPDEKGIIMQGFSHEIRDELYSGAYVPAPDLGTGSRQMADIFDETHIKSTVTGKPVGIGGIPGRREATGYGVMTATKMGAKKILGSKLSNLKVAIQGFGNVGAWTAKFLREQGAKIVSVSSVEGTIHNEEGLDIEELFKIRKRIGDRCILGYGGAEMLEIGDELSLNVDILIPAATGNVLTKNTSEEVKADLIVEAANSPTTTEGDKVLTERKIPVIPDLLANAGGVVASYIEWMGGKSGSNTKKEDTYKIIKENIQNGFKEVEEVAEEKKIFLRRAAMTASTLRLRETMKGRGWI